MNNFRRFWFCLLFGLAVAASNARAGEIIVLESTDPALAVGRVLPDHALRVAAGAKVVLLGQDGRGFTVNGPHEGAPGTAVATAGGSRVRRQFCD